ncbi:hypothetical protein Tco_0727122 [Tanacetum coccineum]|uniref:Uncharacterized protein n=1 Tax=Tanacetum coccineum TaxID=301880 RepID=A0ABQ4YIG6_9ASTR
MDDPNITMEEYIRLEEEKSRRHGKVLNWQTTMYGKIWDNEDVHDLGSVETKFPAIVFNDTLTSEDALSCEPTDLTQRKSISIGGKFKFLEILKCWSLETSRRLFNTILLINATWRIYRGFAAALAVLVTGASQSKQHESRKSPTAVRLMLTLEGFPFITVNSKEYHSEFLAITTRIMRRTL